MYYRTMGIAAITPILLLAAIARSRSEPTGNYNQNLRNGASNFGELLKPPPPPYSNILPVPFHGGNGRTQRQNNDLGYDYQPPPPPPPPPIPGSANFKFPTPFYKQYNFNFVPPPQPFSTPASPSVFQKVSSWLFPPTHSSPTSGHSFENNAGPVKKDCNPCNLVPWVPVIKYNAPRSNLQQSANPTYGPPSPTAVTRNIPGPFHYSSQPFHPTPLEHINTPSNGVPQAHYGAPSLYNENYIGNPSSTYGPPSPTHTIAEISKAPLSSSYGPPAPTYGPPTSTYSNPSSYSPTGIVNTGFSPVSTNYGTPPSKYKPPLSTEVEIIKSNTVDNEFHLPKVYYPNGFKNSYGEPITANGLNSYSVPATAAEASKLKPEILPFVNSQESNNSSFASSKPAPFTSNRGRNIHTLQPVALPNLSVSPLPPIFNARPFRPIPAPVVHADNINGINGMQHTSNGINVVKSVPIAEFTHSIEYPATIVQSPVIDIDLQHNYNQSKSYRNIPNTYLGEESRDISSQASEDHVSATNTENSDSSFESTGEEHENNLYNNNAFTVNLKPDSSNYNIPLNHKALFADLRGVSNNDVDKYRTESNLKHIDSPLLYLKPSAPHKEFDNFLPTPLPNDNDFEIYDDVTTTASTLSSSISDTWNNYKTAEEYSDGLSPPPIKQDTNNPKIVQIIIPYTTNQNVQGNNIKSENTQQQWLSDTDILNQGRKVASNTDNNFPGAITETQYSTQNSYIEEVTESDAEQSNYPTLNTAAILNDLYDIKEEPFDIIKLQNNIDGWTEQEYSNHVHNTHGIKPSGKYAHAKQIPDEYFTTANPIVSYATTSSYDYNFYDHEGSSSMQHSVLDRSSSSTTVRPRKEYNSIERFKDKSKSDKKLITDETLKPHIYTASSTFRGTTTTPPPWEKIGTSISPLTKEKIYVVTSKPWRDNFGTNNTWHDGVPFESKRTTAFDNDVSASDNLPFKSPRFSNRPPILPSGNGNTEPLRSDSSFGFSKTWHQSINDLEADAVGAKNHTSIEGPVQRISTNVDKENIHTSTARTPEVEPNS